MAIPYKKLFGLCSVLPRWGKPWVSFVFGYKHAVPTGRGERKGSGFFYKHIVPMGRGEKRLGWFFLVNMAARRDGGCSSGAVGLYKTLSLMKLVRRRCSMFWGWLPTTQTPPAPALKTALVFTNISSRWDGKGLSECFLD